jgi:phenylalanyl-tRNA synthetase beta chain
MSADRSALRQSLLPSMLQTVWENLRHQERVALFEIAKVYLPTGNLLPDEPVRLSLALSGKRSPMSWTQADTDVDFFDLKGAVEAIGRALHVEFEYRPQAHDSYHPGRCAQVIYRTHDGAERSVGTMGQIHPVVAERFDLGREVYTAELELAALSDAAQDIPRVQAPPRYPGVELDLAIVVEDHVPERDIEQLMKTAGGDLLASVRLFDIYRGSPVPEGSKSLAFSLTIRADDRTLTDDEATAVRSDIESRLGVAFNAQIRGR